MACSGVSAKGIRATVGEIFAKFVYVFNSVSCEHKLCNGLMTARIRLKPDTWGRCSDLRLRAKFEAKQMSGWGDMRQC